MKKIILILTICVCLCGCEKNQENKYSESSGYMGDRFTLYVDEQTCVEYFVSNGSYNNGNVFLRYNQDGTLKLNKECLKDLVGS